MKKIMTMAAIAMAAAGCSSSGAPTPKPTVTVTAKAAAHGPSAHPVSRTVRRDEKLLVDALANGNSASIQSAARFVTGPVMASYIRFQATEAEARESSGIADTAGKVTPKGKGSYRTCYPQASSPCETFTAFQSGAGGRVRGMSVDGQPVAPRIAAGPPDRGRGIVITDVTSYRYSTPPVQVGVTFLVRNVSNHGLSVSDPPFLPALAKPDGTVLRYDFQDSVMPETLQPGEGAAVTVIFDTGTVTGTFILRSNGAEVPLVSSRLTMP